MIIHKRNYVNFFLFSSDSLTIIYLVNNYILIRAAEIIILQAFQRQERELFGIKGELFGIVKENYLVLRENYLVYWFFATIY